MDNKFKIIKYIKFSLAANIILNNSIFAGCNKKGNKGNKSTENNITPNEEQSKEEKPEKPDKQDKDYNQEKQELLSKFNDIVNGNNKLTSKISDFNEEELRNEINSIDSEEKHNSVNTKLESFYKVYIAKLNEEAEILKTEYNSLKDEINKLPDGGKKTALKTLLILEDKNFTDITDWNKIVKLRNDINKIKILKSKGIDDLKKEYLKKYEEYKTTNLSLGSNIAEINNELETKINNLSNENIAEVIKALNSINTKIEEAKKKKVEEDKKKEEEDKKKKEEDKKKKEEEDKKKKKEEEKKIQDIIKSFKNGYEIDNTCKLTIKLEGNKFKLYFKENILIAESESEIDEKNIKTADDYKNSKYTIILSFADRCTHYIKNLTIDDIIKNIKSCKDTLDKYCKKLDHCYINININFDEANYDDSYYDINTGGLFYTQSCFSDSSLKDEIKCIVPITGINTAKKFTISTDRAYYNEKYGKLAKKDSKKDSNKYFVEDSTIKDINDTFKNEVIANFSKISLV